MRDEMNIVGVPLNTERTRIERRYNRGYYLTPEERKELLKDLNKFKGESKDKVDNED